MSAFKCKTDFHDDFFRSFQNKVNETDDGGVERAMRGLRDFLMESSRHKETKKKEREGKEGRKRKELIGWKGKEGN